MLSLNNLFFTEPKIVREHILLEARAYHCPFLSSQMCILFYESYSSFIDHILLAFYCIKAA